MVTAWTDIDQLERDISDAPGDVVAFGKDTILEVLAELRLGQAALRTSAAVPIESRVSSGYPPPEQSLAP